MSVRSGTANCALGANPRGPRVFRWLLLVALLLGEASVHNDRGVATRVAKPRTSGQWAHLYCALPLSFEANQGQVDGQVKYLARGRAYTLFLTRDEAVLRFRGQKPFDSRQVPPATDRGPLMPDPVLRLRLVGASSNAVVTGGDELPGKANYFLGNDPSQWRTNVPTYARVKYENIYPGVNLLYYGNQEGQLEYDFVVAPGADPAAIKLDLGDQGSALRIAGDGDLLVPLEDGQLRFHKPVVYQPGSDQRSGLSILQRPNAGPGIHPPDTTPRTVVDGRYILTASNQVRFELGPYDRTKPLVIDPVLYYATYLGGSGGDIGNAIAVDSNFEVYIAGSTSSANFPTKAASGSTVEQSGYGGNGDAFVAKLNSTGTALIYSTYLGGSGADFAYAIAVSAGDAFITGTTYSKDFPTASPGTSTTPFQQTYGGAGDAFVTELNATGSKLVFSSYLGGNGLDQGLGIAVDSSGDVYVTGYTQSANFPTYDPLYASINGTQDAFVTKVSYTGEQILYSTFLGGSQADVGQSIQVDSSGNMYVAGYTFSSDFPTTNAEQPKSGGGVDAFVTEIASAGTSLVFSTYLGGSDDDRAYGLALDSSGNIYVVGTTFSTDFPVTSGAYQTSNAGGADAFVCKFNPAGSQRVYSTYLGGSDTDRGQAIAVNSSGNAYVTGSTRSSNFPTYNAIQSILGISAGILCGASPCPDAFVTELNSAGNGVVYSTYLGGSGYDSGQGIAVDSTGDPYITGNTLSSNFPATFTSTSSSTVAPFQTILGGTSGNAFAAKIDSANVSNIALVPNTVNFGSQTLSVRSPIQTVTVINPSTQPLVISGITNTGSNSSTKSDFAETDDCVGTHTPGSSYCTISLSFTPSTTSAETGQFTITDNANNVTDNTQTIAVSGTGTTVATQVTVSPTSLTFSNQAVGTTSAAQNVTITNTGTSTLNITSISTGTSDFAETDTCSSLNDTLSVNQSCVVSVTFTPTASGTRSGTLSIQDNATGSPQSVALSGTGIAAFSLSASPATSTVLIGSTSASFTISAASSTGFTGNITLGPSCPSNLVCTYSTNPIFAGQSTTLTVSDLTTSMANPYNFTITGTSGTQSASVPLTILFQDYTLSATPTLDTITSGTAATYTIIVSPLNSFNKQVSLSCDSTGFPPDATCTFSNSSPTPNGGPTNVTLTINTVKYVEQTLSPPRHPPGKIPPLVLGVLTLLGLASLALTSRRRARHGPLAGAWLGFRLATLSLILALNLTLGSCRPATTAGGTTTGNYTITIDGTMTSNTAVVRKTVINLAVT